MACDLLGRNGRWIARFWSCPYDGAPLACEPDTVAVWAPPAALPGLPVSPWHRAVLAAVAAGRKAVDAPG
jgi:hypothetical protein